MEVATKSRFARHGTVISIRLIPAKANIVGGYNQTQARKETRLVSPKTEILEELSWKPLHRLISLDQSVKKFCLLVRLCRI